MPIDKIEVGVCAKIETSIDNTESERKASVIEYEPLNEGLTPLLALPHGFCCQVDIRGMGDRCRFSHNTVKYGYDGCTTVSSVLHFEQYFMVSNFDRHSPQISLSDLLQPYTLTRRSAVDTRTFVTFSVNTKTLVKDLFLQLPICLE